MIRNVFYRMDWQKPNQENVKEFLHEQMYSLSELSTRFDVPKFSGTNDSKMLQILKWVKNNFTYEIDEKRFKVAEKWQTCEESLIFKRMDCEDGAILIYALAIYNKVNIAQLKLCAGNVTEGGHCWIEYLSDEFFYEDKWFTIDWCYYYDDSKFKYREAKSNRYKTTWFEVSGFI